MLEKLADLKREVEFAIDGEKWRFLILRPEGKLRRAKLISQILGMAPIESVSQDDYSRAYIIATLTISYMEGPQTFVEKFNKDFSEIPDDDYLQRLFNKYNEADKRFEESKKKFRPPERSEEK